ncbi:hypothetical protein EGY31_13050 [Burkholderia multivorans]|nr:hypothetical protein EGY31_13050 [Burkholderia multivorans]
MRPATSSAAAAPAAATGRQSTCPAAPVVLTGRTGGVCGCAALAAPPVAAASLAPGAVADAPASPAAGRGAEGVCGRPASAAAPVAAGLPIPCFCSSISTRFFSASNCCRLDGRACDAAATGAAPGAACEPAAGTPGVDGAAASLADDGAAWIEPLHTCGPLAPACCAAGSAPGPDAPCAADAPTAADAPAVAAAACASLVCAG